MTCAGDLTVVLSARLKCSPEEAREHLKFIFKQADDPNFSLRFEKDYEWDHGMSIYHDVVRFLGEVA